MSPVPVSAPASSGRKGPVPHSPEHPPPRQKKTQTDRCCAFAAGGGVGDQPKNNPPGTERVLPTLGASPGRGALGHRVCQWHEWLCERHAVTARISPVKVLCDRGHANGRRLLWSSPVVQSHLSGPSPGAPWLTLWPSGSLQAGRPHCPSRRSWKRQGFCPGAPQGARSCQRLAVGLRASGSERE